MHWLLNEKALLTIVAAFGYGLATILMKILSDRADVVLPVVLAIILMITTDIPQVECRSFQFVPVLRADQDSWTSCAWYSVICRAA